MYVGRPSVSADSDHSSALITQMQATAHAASFSSSHPGDNTPDTKRGTPSVLCAASAYRNLIGDSNCFFKVLTALFYHTDPHFSINIPVTHQVRYHSARVCSVRRLHKGRYTFPLS